MATKAELDAEANELNLNWRREQDRRKKYEAALRDLVAAADKVEKIFRDPEVDLDELDQLASAVERAKELL